MQKEERAFLRLAAGISALFASIIYFPVFLGKIPFPGDLLLWFPVWADRIRPNVRSFAEIGDLITFFYPLRSFGAQSIKHGVFPVWNPLMLSGEPFLANSQSALFYPLNVLFYLAPFRTAWAISMMLRMFLAGFFTSLFVRSIGGSKTGSIFSGILFAGCGFMTVWQGQAMSDSAIWMPVACYAVVRLHKQVSKINIAIASIAFAMPVLAGHPETAAHITLTGTGLALMLWCFPAERDTSRFDFRFIAAFAGAGVLAVGLASAQIVPTLEWLKQIGEAFYTWPPLPLYQALGWVSRDVWRNPNSAGILIPEAAAYMAMIGILALPLAWFHRPKVYVAFLFIAASCGIAVAYNIGPLYTVVSHIPVLGSLKNFRMLIGSFSVACLSGLGISVLEERSPFTHWRRPAAVGILAATFGFVFLMVYELQLNTAFKAEVTHRPSFSRTLLIVGLIPLAWRIYGGLRGRAFPILVCSIAVFDLTTFGYDYMSFVNRNDIFPESPAFNFLRQTGESNFRIIEVGQPYPSNAAILYGLESADGYEASFITKQQEFVKDLIDKDSNGINFVTAAILSEKDRRLDLLNIKYIVVPGFVPEYKRLSQSDRFTEVFNNKDIAIFKNPSALPRAWMVSAGSLETFSTFDEELNRLKGETFDPLYSATLSEQQMPLRVSNTESFTGSPAITEDGAAGVGVKTQSSGPAVLVISQTYYPGWKATLDGTPADVLRVDGTLTGVVVPAGAHEVRMVFQPSSFKIGLAITIVSTVILLFLIAAGLRSQRKGAKRDAVPADKLNEIPVR